MYGTVFLSPRASSCADLFVPDPHLCVQHVPMGTLKNPISTCHRSVGLTAGGPVVWSHKNTTLYTIESTNKRREVIAVK